MNNVTDTDDLIDGRYYYVRTRQGGWEIRRYTPASKAFTQYGSPNVFVTDAMALGVIPVALEPAKTRKRKKKASKRKQKS